jgi:hypothetical protein
MASILYRIELNPLTKPASYKLRFMPQGVAGYDEVAKRIAAKNPGLTTEAAKAALMSGMEEIVLLLAEGMQVTLENAFTFRPALRARLDSPDDPLPPADELLDITVAAARSCVKAVRQTASLERLPAEEKAPVILAAEDTVLQLNDVLNKDGVLHLTGSNLFFDQQKPDCGCVITGTRNGKRTQNQFARISNSEILLVPRIPAQADPWNNEFIVSLSTQYTENGSMRTGVYGRRLRSPLTVDLASAGESGVGVLTGDAAAPYVRITARAGSGAERLRIQAALDLGTDVLSLNLLAMQERGAAGSAINITGNGSYVLPGFSGSAVSSLTVQVDQLAALKTLLRSSYHGRMADILDLTA